MVTAVAILVAGHKGASTSVERYSKLPLKFLKTWAADVGVNATCFWSSPYQESFRDTLKDKKASNTAQGLRKVLSELGIPAHIYSDDGTEFKKEFREALECWDINKLYKGSRLLC